MDFEAAGQEGSEQRKTFVHDLVEDMSNATGLPSDHFAVKKLSKGSIIAHIEIRTDDKGAGPDANTVIIDLQQQYSDPDSPFCHGLLTRHTQSITLVPLDVRFLASQTCFSVQIAF